MVELSKVQQFILFIIPALFAITLHEVAHGWAALKFGDYTAKLMGRLSLNPLKHVDLTGTIIVPTILFFLSGFILGWAKPVPVRWENLNNPRRDMALVALAGPGANFTMALIWAALWKLCLILFSAPNYLVTILIFSCQIGILFNLVLMVINLIPIPPLDGSRIVSSLLSPKIALQYNSLEPYGFFILLGLIVTGILGKIALPFIIMSHSLILAFFGLS